MRSGGKEVRRYPEGGVRMRGGRERVEMKWNVLKKILLGGVDGVEGGERQRRVRELVFERHRGE